MVKGEFCWAMGQLGHTASKVPKRRASVQAHIPPALCGAFSAQHTRHRCFHNGNSRGKGCVYALETSPPPIAGLQSSEKRHLWATDGKSLGAAVLKEREDPVSRLDHGFCNMFTETNIAYNSSCFRWGADKLPLFRSCWIPVSISSKHNEQSGMMGFGWVLG